MKKKILLVGENPFGKTGNSGMLRALLGQIDAALFDMTVLAIEVGYIDPIPLMFNPVRGLSIIYPTQGDQLGSKQLIECLKRGQVDVLLMVGIDIWLYHHLFDDIVRIRKERGFKWAWIFPYDLQDVRKDYVKWFNLLDMPCVYSRYGEEVLRPHVPGIRYFRPMLREADMLERQNRETRLATRRRMFPDIEPDDMLYGFIGNNQIRKDPQALLKAFAITKKEVPSAKLYMHCKMTIADGGYYNLIQYADDCGVKPGDLLGKGVDGLSAKQVVDLYNSFDCLVNCTVQEGLSWTPLEAMLCGVPVIASRTTAQTELVEDAGMLIPCETESYMFVVAERGQTWVDAKKCRAEDIADAMILVAKDHELREKMISNGLKRGKEWLDGVSDINDLLKETVEAKVETAAIIKGKPRQAVLFMQHSSAGDVYMTTKALGGIRARHPGMKLEYMTSAAYMDIVTNNSMVDAVIPWDIQQKSNYMIAYNPHGEIIGPGYWGRNSNSLLSDFYWKILRVERGDLFIDLKEPENEDARYFYGVVKNSPICVVHTTGGDPAFRMYKFMADVCEALRGRYITIQLGSNHDYPAGADIDLRGKTGFRESAWVMSKAKIAVTVDSFISHLAGGLGVSQVCLFGCGNVHVVRPDQVRGTLICLIPDYIRDCPGLGPCSANVRDCPTPCTGLHEPDKILKALYAMEMEGFQDTVYFWNADKAKEETAR